jgi:hypothetical protein
MREDDLLAPKNFPNFPSLPINDNGQIAATPVLKIPGTIMNAPQTFRWGKLFVNGDQALLRVHTVRHCGFVGNRYRSG